MYGTSAGIPFRTREGSRWAFIWEISTEGWSGVLPGDSFPVFEADMGRIVFNICTDSSADESSRTVGLSGADFLVLPITGDHRANRVSPGAPMFNGGRWRAIVCTHAIDNRLCMVVARNRSLGSCVIDRMGEIPAYDEADADHITADLPLDDAYVEWNGMCTAPSLTRTNVGH